MIARNALALALLAAPPAPAPERPLILFLGTSLTAGYGLEDPSQAYPALIQAKLDGAGLAYQVVNGGVSGETSAGAVRRLEWLLRRKIRVLVVETGANDGLRGQDPEATRANIQAIFDRARRQSPPPRLVLAGMQALPNYGEAYRRRYGEIFPELAKKNDAVLIPFLLEGVAGIPALNQGDGIHPTAEGQRRVAETVWRALRPLLGKDIGGSAKGGEVRRAGAGGRGRADKEDARGEKASYHRLAKVDAIEVGQP